MAYAEINYIIIIISSPSSYQIAFPSYFVFTNLHPPTYSLEVFHSHFQLCKNNSISYFVPHPKGFSLFFLVVSVQIPKNFLFIVPSLRSTFSFNFFFCYHQHVQLSFQICTYTFILCRFVIPLHTQTRRLNIFCIFRKYF